MDERKNIKYVGHRGSKGVGVENTIEAFKEGINRKYYALECDIRVTKDNQFIIFHDENLERLVPNFYFKSSSIHTFSYEELKQLTLIQVYHNKYLTGKIPLLKEFLQLCKKSNVIAIIEIKWSLGLNNNDNSNVCNLINLIKQEGMYEKSIILTSMKNTLKFIRDNYQDMQLQLLIGGNNPINNENLKFAIENQLSLDIKKELLNKEIIKLLHDNNLLVNTWVVNDIIEANVFNMWGTDMITTDLL